MLYSNPCYIKVFYNGTALYENFGFSGWREMKEKHETKLRDKIYEAYGKSWKEEEIDKKTNDITSSVKFCCQNADLVSITYP